MIYVLLFWEFFKTGLFAVGGGLATLPFLKEISLKYPWFTPDDLMNMIAVSESTPGPIGVNASTYAGFHAAGLPGALIATGAIVLPSVVIVLFISRALTRFRDSTLVSDVFSGLRPASTGLILGAMASVFAATFLSAREWNGLHQLLSIVNLPAVLCFAAILITIKLLPRIHPVVFIIAGAVIGILLQF